MYESPKHKISTVVDSASNAKKMIKQIWQKNHFSKWWC
jgi:hypothetical protein